MPTDLPVRDAAKRLGVNPSRVRALISAGLLDATKVGDRWLVNPASVERRVRIRPPMGRPLGAAGAWAFLLLASGEGPRGTGRKTRSGRGHRQGEKSLESILPRLGRRAHVHRLRAHPSYLERIAREPGVVRTGASAACEHGSDLVAPGELEAYVGKDRFQVLRRRYALQPSRRPNLVLRAIEAPWPFRKGVAVAPAVVVAVDLLESNDARTLRAGRELLRRMGPA